MAMKLKDTIAKLKNRQRKKEARASSRRGLKFWVSKNKIQPMGTIETNVEGEAVEVTEKPSKMQSVKLKRPKGKKRVKSPKRSSSGLAFKASKGEKFILFVGDEGAILTFIIGKTVQSRQFVPDAGAQSLKELKQIFSKNPDVPLFLIIDNMDQTYMQQSLPPVSALSINKLVKRRLDRDFADTEIKGAIPLGREKKGRKDWNFMMVGVEQSPQLSVWLDFIDELPNYFRGIYLVAIEAEYLVRYIEHSIKRKPDEEEARWKFLVSHNKVGGFRQVILRDGKIVFTRLAQPIGDSSTEMVAGNIEQEMQSTIEYMKRLSYTPEDGLDIYIIASAGIKEVIDANKFANARLHIFTPYELAQKIGIEGATQPTDQFGDVLLAAIIGCSKKHVMVFSTPLSKKIGQFYQILNAQRVTAVIAGLGIIGYAGTVAVGYFSLSGDQDGMQDEMRKQRARVTVLRDEIRRSDLDIEKANDLLQIYQQLLKEEVSPLPFIQMLRPLKTSPVWINSLHWQLGDGKTTLAAFPTGPGTELMRGSVTLEFLNVITDPKGFKLVSGKILADTKGWFPGYEVDFTDIPARYTGGDSLQISFDDPKEEAANADSKPLEVSLEIKGTLLNEPLRPKPKTKQTNSAP